MVQRVQSASALATTLGTTNASPGHTVLLPRLEDLHPWDIRHCAAFREFPRDDNCGTRRDGPLRPLAHCRVSGTGSDDPFRCAQFKRVSHQRCVAILRRLLLRRTFETQRPGRSYALGCPSATSRMSSVLRRSEGWASQPLTRLLSVNRRARRGLLKRVHLGVAGVAGDHPGDGHAVAYCVAGEHHPRVGDGLLSQR